MASTHHVVMTTPTRHASARGGAAGGAAAGAAAERRWRSKARAHTQHCTTKANPAASHVVNPLAYDAAAAASATPPHSGGFAPVAKRLSRGSNNSLSAPPMASGRRLKYHSAAVTEKEPALLGEGVTAMPAWSARPVATPVAGSTSTLSTGTASSMTTVSSGKARVSQTLSTQSSTPHSDGSRAISDAPKMGAHEYSTSMKSRLILSSDAPP